MPPISWITQPEHTDINTSDWSDSEYCCLSRLWLWGDLLVHKSSFLMQIKASSQAEPLSLLQRRAPFLTESALLGSWDTDQGDPCCCSCTRFIQKNQILKLDAKIQAMWLGAGDWELLLTHGNAKKKGNLQFNWKAEKKTNLRRDGQHFLQSTLIQEWIMEVT